jgi:hypothetical protein
MAESLMDFQGAAHLAMQQRNLELEQQRNQIYEQNSLQQAERNRITDEQNQQVDDARRASNLMTFAKDPAIRANPANLYPILAETFKLIGPKNVTPDVMKQGIIKGADDMQEALTGLVSGDREQALKGFTMLSRNLEPQQVDQIVKAAGDTSKLAENIHNLGLMQMYEKDRFDKLDMNLAKVRVGELPMLEAARSSTHLLQGTDNPAYQQVAKVAAKTPLMGGQTLTQVAASYAKIHPEFAAGGKFATKEYTEGNAQTANNAAQKMNILSGQAQKDLEDFQKGLPLPPHTTEHDLRAKIDVGNTLMDAYGVMANFAEDPYNLDKLKEAKKSQAIIIEKTKELNTLKSSSSNEKNNIYRDVQMFKESEAGIKHALTNATAEAQTRFAALPSASQHSQGAALIARAVERDMNVKVPIEDILKGKEKPTAEGSLTADQSANLVIKTLAQAAGDAGAADVIDPVTGAVDFGRLIHKSARDQQAFIDSIRTKSKLKEFSSIKDSLEIVARDAVEKMTTTAASKREMLDAKSQLPPVDSKEIQDALATGKPFVYEKGNHKFKLEGKGKSQQWVVVE